MTEPRPPKRERTRRALLDAGLQVLAERGDALTASDVVHAADVSNGTFYNHFADRDAFIRALAHESLLALTIDSALDTAGTDPAWRFAVGSTRVLEAARRQPLWAHAVLRLAELPAPPHEAIQAHLRNDLADGLAAGRFVHGDDPVTVDLVSGTLMATLRRLIDDPGHADAAVDVVTRLLIAVGIASDEAGVIAEGAHANERRPAVRNPSPA
ncbi:MAG: TetR/AcrR family transcriptional regulator [Actinomycetota bacterium]